MKRDKPRITVVGSSNMDLVVKSTRIPLIGETILGEDFIMTPGGKGANQAMAAENLLECGVKAVILTMGAKGFLLASNERTEFVDAVKVEAVDATAAGDAFTGGLAFGLAQGRALFEAALFANRVAALSVTKMGAQSSMPTAEAVESFMK